MICKNCIVSSLTYDIKIENEKHFVLISNYANRLSSFIQINGSVISVKESLVREIYDFSCDHLDTNLMYFRLEHQDWRPFTEIIDVLNMQWIDEVILNEHVSCHYQPIVDANQTIYAHELLARFQSNDGTLIYPNVAFDAARTRGRLYALDKLCRMTAVKHAAVLNNKAFINFIPTSIYSPEHCLRSTVNLANQLGIDPYQLVFEVVETEEVEDIDHLKEILRYYHEKGFHYALDDVGEGYSTIDMLSELKPNYMKLDMKYVQGIGQDVKKQRIAKLFLEKSIEIGSIPLAEGVESQEDFEWLKNNRYQLFQGYLFGKPSPKPYGNRMIGGK